MATESRLVRISNAEVGQRFDRILDVRFPEFGRRFVRELFESGRVLRAGQRVHKGERALHGQELTILLAERDLPEAQSELPLVLRLERPDVVVVSKPAGMPSAPLTLEARGTVVNALLARYPELRGVGGRAREPGIVHRLDTYTSGLLVAARTQRAFEVLEQALRSGGLEKRYWACVEGRPSQTMGSIQYSLSPDPKRAERVLVQRKPGTETGYVKQAHTEYCVLQQSAERALLEVTVSRAFRHQIRAHLAAIGHPIVGDTVYGATPDPQLAPGRFALHASYVAWAGDSEVGAFALWDDLPGDIAGLLTST